MRVLQCGEVRDAGEAEVRPGSLRELQGRVRGHLLVQGVCRRLNPAVVLHVQEGVTHSI